MSENETPQPEEFQDPLENYDPKEYADPLEQAIAEQTVEEIRHEPFLTISPTETIQEGVKKLAGYHVACLLVADEGKLVGVFSDRDVLDKVALEYDAMKDRPIRDVMTSKPISVFDTDAAAAALAVTAVYGYRHVPVVNLDQQVVGIVSPQRVTGFLQQHMQSP